MLCEHVMRHPAEFLREHDSVSVAAERMRDRNVGLLPVCDADGRVVGVITDRDIAIRAAVLDVLPRRIAVSEVMTVDVIACHRKDDVERAEDLMSQHQKSRIVVLDEERRLEGVISIEDVFAVEDPIKATGTARNVSVRNGAALLSY